MVYFLDIKGSFETSALEPATSYEVAFVVKLEDPVSGWENPVDVKLRKPDGTLQESKVILHGKSKGVWFEILAGDFVTNNSGRPGISIDFSLEEHGSYWKKGLILKGVVIRPKTK